VATDLAIVERTSRRIVWGTWGCATIVMAASAANAALTYGALGDNRALGLATGIAVDIGLCVALIGDRQLYVHGLSSTWGRALRITTAVMSLILNTGIALRDGHYFAALLHAFLPVLLVVLTEYGQDVLLKFTALARADADRAVPMTSGPDRPERSSERSVRPGPDLTPTWNAPLNHSGSSAGHLVTVLPGRDGSDRPESPSRPGSTDHTSARAHLIPGSGALEPTPAGRLVNGPLPTPVRPEVPVRPSGVGRPTGPDRDDVSAGDSVGDTNGSTTARPRATVHKRPARNSSGSKRAGGTGRSQAGAAGRSDEQLVQAARELAGRSEGPLTQYALRQAFGLGSARAARLLAQLDPVPVGSARHNGQAQVKGAK
jgi:hypothetical protein